MVVDNASRGPVPEAFTAPCPGLRLVARPHNDGFAAGVNAGWRVARSPWLLVLNPDVEVARGFLGQVFARLGHSRSRSRWPAGDRRVRLAEPRRLSPGLGRASFPPWPGPSGSSSYRARGRKYQAGWRIRSGRVDWVTGACMLVNSAMIAALGGMDEDFFLYYEEVAFSRAAQRLGWAVEYDASVTVVHRHPLQNRPISPKMRVITRHSKLLYFLKHLPRWQFLSLSAIVAIEAAVRGIVVEALATAGRRSRVANDRRGRSPAAERSRAAGRDVLTLAESVAHPGQDLERTHPAAGRRLEGRGPSGENAAVSLTSTPRRLRRPARRFSNHERMGPSNPLTQDLAQSGLRLHIKS